MHKSHHRQQLSLNHFPGHRAQINNLVSASSVNSHSNLQLHQLQSSELSDEVMGQKRYNRVNSGQIS